MNNMLVFTVVDNLVNRGMKMSYNKDFIVSIVESDSYFSFLTEECKAPSPFGRKVCQVHALAVRRKGFLFGKKLSPICFTVAESFDELVKQLDKIHEQ